jgi:hypothetical protein
VGSSKVKALMVRRDKIVARFQRPIAEKGGSDALFLLLMAKYRAGV